MTAVSTHGKALLFALKELKANREIVMILDVYQGPLNGGVSRWGGCKRSGFFCPFLSFLGLSRFCSGIFPICSGMVRGFSRFVLFLFLGLLRAPTRNSPERVHDKFGPFPKKVGNTRVWKPHGLASLSNLGEPGAEVLDLQKRSLGKGVLQKCPLSRLVRGLLCTAPPGTHPRIRLALPSSGVDLASIQHRFDIETTSIS